MQRFAKNDAQRGDELRHSYKKGILAKYKPVPKPRSEFFPDKCVTYL